MTKKYFSWFLENFDNYEYVGEEACSIRRRLKRMSERTIAPSPQEAIEIYVAFFKHYNGDPFSSKSKYIEGIRAKRNEYCLMFRDPDNTPISFAYKREMAGGVTEGELKDVLDLEKERKIKYYTDMLEFHNGIMEKTEDEVEDITNEEKPSIAGKTSIGFFFLAVIFAAIAAIIMFVPDIAKTLGMVDSEGKAITITWIGFGFAALLLVLHTTLGFIVGERYAYKTNARAILLDMDDFKRRVQRNISRLRKYDTQPMRQALRNGKQIKPIIADSDYQVQLKYFGTSLQVIQAKLEQKPKAARVLFFIVTILTLYVAGFFCVTPIADFLNKTPGKDYLIYIIPAIPTFIFFLICLCSKMYRKIRFWKLLLLLIFSLAIVALMILLLFTSAA